MDYWGKQARIDVVDEVCVPVKLFRLIAHSRY
jgi:hypothetical protein